MSWLTAGTVIRLFKSNQPVRGVEAVLACSMLALVLAVLCPCAICCLVHSISFYVGTQKVPLNSTQIVINLLLNNNLCLKECRRIQKNITASVLVLQQIHPPSPVLFSSLCVWRALGGGLQTLSKVFAVHVNIVYSGKPMYKQQRPGGDVSGHMPACVWLHRFSICAFQEGQTLKGVYERRFPV